MSDFSLVIRENSPAWVVDLMGYLDAHTAPELELTFRNLLDDSRYNIIVNFQRLNYISSAGLGVFMAFIEEVRGSDGDIKLVGMSPKVYNVFDLLGFPMLYEIFDEERQAIQKFEESSPATE